MHTVNTSIRKQQQCNFMTIQSITKDVLNEYLQRGICDYFIAKKIARFAGRPKRWPKQEYV